VWSLELCGVRYGKSEEKRTVIVISGTSYNGNQSAGVPKEDFCTYSVVLEIGHEIYLSNVNSD
jgi:hypothetical protein